MDQQQMDEILRRLTAVEQWIEEHGEIQKERQLSPDDEAKIAAEVREGILMAARRLSPLTAKEDRLSD